MMDEKGQHADLAERHRSEASHFDQMHSAASSQPRHYRGHPTYPVFQRMLSLLGADLSGRRVLEYGCGAGWVTKELARRGAWVSAFDISPEAVAKTRRMLGAAGLLDRCSVEVGAGEALKYADASFDVAIGFAVLHHLDPERALPELRRVLKPGGRAVYGEPLASNPAIRMYRRLTPQYRTPDEAPLDLNVLSKRVGQFARFEHHDQLLLASAATALCYLPGLTRFAPSVQRSLMRIDDFLLRLAPSAGRWAWYSIIVLER